MELIAPVSGRAPINIQGSKTAAEIAQINQDIADGLVSHSPGAVILLSSKDDYNGSAYRLKGVGRTAAFIADYTRGDLVSSKYGAFFPLNQYNGSGLPRDLSTKSLSLYMMTAMTEALTWGTSGKLTTVAAANSGLVSPVGAQGIDMNIISGKSMLVFFELTKATPGALEGILGWAAGATTSTGTANTGVRVYATTAGKLRVEIVDDTGVLTTLGASTPTVADGTPHTCGLYFNHAFNRFELYVDGYFCNAATFGSTVRKSITQISPLGFGATIGNDTTTVAAQFRGFHVINFETPPSDIGIIVNRLHANPLLSLREGDI